MEKGQLATKPHDVYLDNRITLGDGIEKEPVPIFGADSHDVDRLANVYAILDNSFGSENNETQNENEFGRLAVHLHNTIGKLLFGLRRGGST